MKAKKSQQYVLNETPAVKRAVEKIELSIQIIRKRRDRGACLEAKRNLKQALQNLRGDPILQLKFKRKWRHKTTRRGIDYHFHLAIESCHEAAHCGYYVLNKQDFRRSFWISSAIEDAKDVLDLMRNGEMPKKK